MEVLEPRQDGVVTESAETAPAAVNATALNVSIVTRTGNAAQEGILFSVKVMQADLHFPEASTIRLVPTHATTLFCRVFQMMLEVFVNN